MMKFNEIQSIEEVRIIYQACPRLENICTNMMERQVRSVSVDLRQVDL